MMEGVLQPPIRRRRSTVKVQTEALKETRKELDGGIEPFPREEFLEFCGQLKIQSKDYGLTTFELLGSQLYTLDEIVKGIDEGVCTFVILKSRQLGMSTFFLALDLFWAFKYAGILGVFATHEEASRDQFRAQIDLYLTTLPKRYKVTETTNNRTMLILKNSSLFRYLVAGQRTGTNKLGRSGGTNYMHATEVAFWGSSEDLSALNETLSHLYPHRFYVYESTANGYNHFEEMWQVALSEPSQRAIFVGWWRDERNEFSLSHPNFKFYMPQGLKTSLTKREREGIAAVKEKYGFEINAGQVAWYRWHLATACHGDVDQMEQEQPWVAEDAFVSTGAAFISNEALTRQFKDARPRLVMPFTVKMTEQWIDTIIAPAKAITHCQLKIWEAPSKWGRYTLGCDVAYGSSDTNDLTVISVWRVFADRCYQVAEFATPEASTYQCAWMLAYLGGLYQDCMVNIEITGPGLVVVQELDRLRHDAHKMGGPDAGDMRNVLSRMRDFLYRRADSMSGGLVRQWKTTPGSTGTKPVLMNRFKNYVELGLAQIRSMTCIEECRRLRNDGGNIEASTGHDDRAIAAALAVYAWAEWRIPELKAKGWTYDHAMSVEKHGGEDPVNGLVRKFLALQKIQVKDKEADR
jgi:Terminase RNaseH-like domain